MFTYNYRRATIPFMNKTWRDHLHEIIFEADTPAGKAFDIILIWVILSSVGLVMLDSIESIHLKYGQELYILEWGFTIIFAIEYILRVISVKRPLGYIFSFFGMIDLMAILPTVVSLVFPGTQSLLVVRIFRLMRVFRILKLGLYLGEAQILVVALQRSRAKITVFLFAVAATVVSMGALMYVIEGGENGFTSIPTAIYWSIVTMTTVGFGDITPQTPLGQFFASCLMIAGYGIIAVPTGIVTTEIARASRHDKPTTQACPHCSSYGHEEDAKFCKHCGFKL